MTLSQAASVLGAERVGIDAPFQGVSTDSRSLPPGTLFVALRGDRFDGHDFVDAAVAAGAAGVLVEQWPDGDIAALRVADSLDALQRLAAHWRRGRRCTLAAITGSNGKTTVKEMLGAIASRAAPTLVSAGNLNNHIGVPLSLLRLGDEHRYAVIEMGMNHAGELALLSSLAKPDVALVNNAAAAHLEGLGSVAGVAAAKAEIFGGLGEDGIAVINADDAFADHWRALNRHRRRLTFALEAEADVRGSARVDADHLELSLRHGDVRIDTRLSVGGVHNARNALAAASVAIALGIDETHIADGLAAFRPVSGRSEAIVLGPGLRLVNDTYNANPASMAAAVDMLCRYDGRRVLVMGDMGELGPTAGALHRQAGEHARASGVDDLFTLGPASREAAAAFGSPARAFDDIDALLVALRPCLADDGQPVTVLVKGSRAMRMERITQALRGETEAR